ncbi:MAG: hypothetical protein EP329_00710 [Deltaproteobacteria bacterium]|nr:MAG: hypothetical protein EP329_00710 [Deltaproteobacteria bacterium]
MRLSFDLAGPVVLATLLVACGAAPNGHLRFELSFDGDPAAAAERVRERLAVVDERDDVTLGEITLEETAKSGLIVDVAVRAGARCEGFEAARNAVRDALAKPHQLSLREVLAPEEDFIAQVKAALGEGVGVARERDEPYLLVSAPEGTDVAARVAGIATRTQEAAAERIDAPPGRKIVAPSWRIWPVARQSELRDGDIEQARATFSDFDNSPIVQTALTAAGAQRFETLTARLTDAYLAILVDGEVMSVPKVMEPIGGGRIQITMGARNRPISEVFGEAQLLAAGLRGGPIASNVKIQELAASCVPAE